jgi:Rps23 Pro-64 3,4-dihydroxylase Tpa1-like proline 4-hydroxylase
MTAVTVHPELRLDARLDRALIARVYRQVGRVHVPDVFPAEVATRVHAALAHETPWQLSLANRGTNAGLDLATWDGLSAEQQAELARLVHDGAAHGFSYLFRNFPLDDQRAAGRHLDHYLMRVLEFLNSPAFLTFAREITGAPGIRRLDAQATLYLPGHFLTRHDDHDPPKRRVAAYVLNLTPEWRADWGGILQFLDADGHVSEGYVPAFNALNVFRVPQPHAVSYVAPFARAGRYSITGWMRED